MTLSLASSDRNEFRRAACVSSRLTGVARECVGEWLPAVFVQGGLVPPLTYLVRSLAERRGQLGNEGRARWASTDSPRSASTTSSPGSISSATGRSMLVIS
eukprot:3906738-Pyramimonas_sp.AAC.1